jgi:cell division protein FtsB
LNLQTIVLYPRGGHLFSFCSRKNFRENIVESIVITWRELLIVVALILAVYIAEMLLLMRTGGGILHKRRMPEPAHHHSDAILRSEIESLSARVKVLEQFIQQLQAESASENTPYARAIQMARQGRNASRISESCGISRGEAELIVSMHGPHE